MLTGHQKKEWKLECCLLSKEGEEIHGCCEGEVRNTQMWIVIETLISTNWKKCS